MTGLDLIERSFYGNTLLDWLVGLALATGVAMLLSLAARVADRRLEAIARRTDKLVWDFLADTLGTTSIPAALAISLLTGAAYLDLGDSLEKGVRSAALVLVIWQAALWVNHFIATWLAHEIREKRSTDGAGATTVAMLGFLGRLGVWALTVLMILSNLGFDITALVASLGIGGIAVALAVQNILGDLFASVSIALDKPFVIGDFIIVGDMLGTVEYIGLKTTRLRSLGGEQLILSNADLLNSRIRNYKRMQRRRIVFSLTVVYQTPADKLEQIPRMIREIIEAQDQASFDRAHFQAFGDSALQFEVVYYVESAEYNVYMDTQQAINLALFRRFQEQGIEFAYPTRTLYTVPAAAAS